MNENNQEKSITKINGNVPAVINLGPTTSIDLSFLSEEERKALITEYAKGMLDVNKRAQELHVDATILKKNLDDLSDTTKEVSEMGGAVTVSHTYTTNVSRTEVLMGNTESATKGKLTKSQTGEKDWTPFYIFAIILAIIIIVALLSR